MKKKTLSLILCLLLVALMGCAAQPDTTAASEPSETEGSTESTDFVYDPTGKKLIALTFDDGPNPGMMAKLVAFLEEEHVPSTFFLVGKKIGANSKDVVLRAQAMGCEFGNHSYSHERMTGLTADEIKQEVQKTQSLVKTITGEEPKYFRPPFLACDAAMYENIELAFIAGTSFSDWESSVTEVDKIVAMRQAARDGAIYLLHCNDESYTLSTIAALKTIVPELRAKGYEFVTLSELFEAKGIDPTTVRGMYYATDRVVE